MLESLFPPQVVCVETPISSLQGDLHPSEEQCVRMAVPKRRREFATGRLCARRALTRLGIENYPLLPGRDRCPRWPPGIVGCISHCEDYCAVAVARAGTILSIGLDLELGARLDTSLWPLILNEAEISWLDRQPERGERAKLLFSAKECTYKCQYPAFSERWEFEDLEVALDEAGRFRAKVQHTSRSPRLGGSHLEGRYRIVGDHIVTTMILLAPPLGPRGRASEKSRSVSNGGLVDLPRIILDGPRHRAVEDRLFRQGIESARTADRR